MTQGVTPYKIGVWGHFHGANQGDECSVAALISNLRQYLPDAQIYGFSQKPSDTTARHGIAAYPLRPRRHGSSVIAHVNTKPSTGQPPKPMAGNQRWRVAIKEPLAARPDPLREIKDWLRRHLPPVYAAAHRLARWIHIARDTAYEGGALVQSWSELRGIKMLIVAGSGPLTDEWGGPWAHAYNLFRWSLLTRLTRTKLVFLCVGAGPIRTRLGRFFIRQAVRRAWYCSFRDESSRHLMQEIGVAGNLPVYPDLGFNLNLPVPHAAKAVGGHRWVVGVNPMAHEDPRYLPGGDIVRYRRYLAKMADFTEWLLRAGHEVIFLYSDVEADPKVCTDLEALLAQRPGLDRSRLRSQTPIQTFEDLIQHILPCDVVVAGRYHCLILSMLLRKPVLGMAYHPKTFDLLDGMGQRSFCYDIDAFDVEQLARGVKRAMARRKAIQATLAERTESHQRALWSQYDRLFSGIVTTAPITHPVTCPIRDPCPL